MPSRGREAVVVQHYARVSIVVPRLEGAYHQRARTASCAVSSREPHHLYTQEKSDVITEIGHLKAPNAGNVLLGCKGHLLADFGCAASLASYKNCLRWRMRIGGSASICTVCVASRVAPGLVKTLTCTGCGEGMYARASLTV